MGNRALQPKVMAEMEPPDLKYLGHPRFVTFVDRSIDILRKLNAKSCSHHIEHNFDFLNRFFRFKKA